MAAAVLGLGGLWAHDHSTAETSARYELRLRYALSKLDPKSTLAVRLRIRLAAETDYRAGRSTAILRMLHEARRSGDPLARAEAANLAHHCLLGPDHSEPRATLATELIKDSQATGRRSDLLLGLLRRIVDGFYTSDLLVERRVTELRGLLADRPHAAIGHRVGAIDVMLAIRSGRLDRAGDMARQSYQDGLSIGDATAVDAHHAQLTLIRWYQGRIAETLPMLSAYGDDAWHLAALAVAAAADGDRTTAAETLAAVCDGDLRRLSRRTGWFGTMYWVAHAALLLGDRAVAQEVIELVTPYAERIMIGGLASVCHGSARHTLGIAALTTGDLDAAVEHLRVAVRRNLALGHWPAVVLSRRWLAHALDTRGRAQDVRWAHTERETATREATELGLLGALAVDDRPLDEAAVCVRQDKEWRVELTGRSAIVDHGVGMLYLATLIANARQEIPAVELVTGAAAVDNLVRMTTDDPERARVAVGKAIRRAIGKITLVDPVIGDHLLRTVQTGANCCYLPS